MSAADDIQKQHDVVLPEEEKDKIETPSSKDEASSSGSAPDPESDDSVDEMVKEVGLYGENGKIQEVDLAKEIKKGERGKRDIPPDK